MVRKDKISTLVQADKIIVLIKYLSTNHTNHRITITSFTAELKFYFYVHSLFGRVMDYEYVNHYFDKKLIPTVQNFVQKLKTAMVSVLESNTSMDSETRYFHIIYYNTLEVHSTYQFN